MSKDTGGAAFPRSESLQYSQHITGGMTLRDYFAAKAIQGMLAENGGGARSNDDLAVIAYALADAMLKARNQ